MKQKFKNIIIIRFFLYITLFLFVSFFLYKGIVPNGKIVYSIKKHNRFFSDLRPEDRIEKDNDEFKVVGDPVYFSLYTPRTFDKAIFKFNYQTENIPSVIEAGILVDKKNWQHILKPVYNKTLNQLSLVWNMIEKDNLYLFQKEKNYESVDEFLNNPPVSEKIAVYNYDLDLEYKMQNYEKNDEFYDLPLFLKSGFDALIYLKNEDIKIDFSKTVESFLYYYDTLLKQKEGKQLEVLNLPEGVYRLQVKLKEDEVLEKIVLSQKKIVFLPQLKFEKKDEKFHVYTDSKKVQLTTVFPEALQIIKMNKQDFIIDKTYKQFEIETKKASSTVAFAELQFEKYGFNLSGDRVFAFREESFFDPRIKKVDRNLDIKEDKIEYVLADYEIPIKNGQWQVAQVEFDLRNAHREDGEYEFMISVPGLRADDGIGGRLIVDGIEVEFLGKSLIDKVK